MILKNVLLLLKYFFKDFFLKYFFIDGFEEIFSIVVAKFEQIIVKKASFITDRQVLTGYRYIGNYICLNYMKTIDYFMFVAIIEMFNEFLLIEMLLLIFSSKTLNKS